MANQEATYHAQLITLGLLGGLFLVFYLLFPSSTAKLPGPWYSKWTDIILKYHWLKGQRPAYVHRLHLKYGPVVRIGPNEVDTCSLDAVKSIYDTRETFKKSTWYSNLAAVNTPVLFSITDVDVHRRLRRLLAAQTTESSLKVLIPLVQERVELYAQQIKQDLNSRGVVDVFKWNLFLATDVIGEVSFGKSFRLLESGKKTQYVRDLEDIGPLGTIRSTFPRLVSIARVIPLPVFKKAAQASRNLRRYGQESLSRYQELVMADPARAKQTLFTKLVNAEKDERTTFEEILANAQGYIVAGSDSTAVCLTYLIWAVCKWPHIKDRLVKELATLPPSYTERDLRDLLYLASIINETLRLYSPVPSGLPREVPAQGAKVAGYWLEGGTTVCAQAYSMHRDATVFPSPESFDPTRWENLTKDMTDSFMPFGRGSRVCLGFHLAYIELRLATARFFLEFPEAKVSTQEHFSDTDMTQQGFFLLSPLGKRCLVEIGHVFVSS